MVEPAEVFWIAHQRWEAQPPALDAFLHQAHIKPAWINAIHLISDAPLLSVQLPEGLPENRTIITWAGFTHSELRILHLAVDELLLGRREISLVISNLGAVTHAILLGSHLAVGRHNLMPRCSLPFQAAFSSSAPFLDALSSNLDQSQMELSSLALLACRLAAGPRPIKKGTPFEKTSWLESDKGSALATCCKMVEALQPSKRRGGLVVEQEQDGLTLAAGMVR